MKQIIADDLGLYPSVNDGIIFLLRENKIAGASLMANGQAFDDAIAKCLEVENLNIGAHLVLVEEKPLTSMVFPGNHKIFFIKYILGLIKLSDIEREFRAQLNKIINAGINPQFINSHQHLHLLPGITDIVIKLAQEYQIPYIRVATEIVFIPRSWYKYDNLFYKFFRFGQLLFLKFLSDVAKRKIKKAGFQCNDFFVGFINAGNLSKNDVEMAQKLAEKYPDKIVELGCHPGYENETLHEKYKHWGQYHWQSELAILKELK